MVVLNCWYILVFFIVRVSCIAVDDNNELLRRLDSTEGFVKALSHRVELLEAREKIYLQRIADLESNDNQQQETIEELKQQLQEQRQLVEPVNNVEPITGDRVANIETNKEQQKYHNKRTLAKNPDSAEPRIRQANVESPVAFLAILSEHVLHAGIKQVIVFDKAITNVGNGYNAAVGIFTAPVEGIYVFSSTLTEYSSGNAAHYSFYHNNNMINIMYVNTNGGESAGATITLHLQKGDVVTVRNDDADDAVYGRLHSSFTGFLLTSYETTQPIIGK